MDTGSRVAVFVVVGLIATIGVMAVVEKGRALARRISENDAALFWSGLGLVTATIIATQIGCTWWLDQRRTADLSAIHYDTGYTKLAVADLEYGRTAITCRAQH